MLAANAKTPTVVIRDLFSSPIEICEWPDAERLNADLRKVILARYETTPSVVQSGRYAWQSDHRLHRWPGACIAEFAGLLKQAASSFAAHLAPDADKGLLENWEIVSCWANVNPPGGYTASHNHSDTGGSLSGVYYVDLGECESPAHAGRTIFEDHSGTPRPAPRDGDLLSGEYAVVPRPGRMALFTTSQYHYVEPNRGPGIRITIAFNLKHRDFRVLTYARDTHRGWWWRNFRGLMILRRKIPEKVSALILSGSYLAREFKGGRGGTPLTRRLKSVIQRAEVDAAAASNPDRVASAAGSPLPEKKQLV